MKNFTDRKSVLWLAALAGIAIALGAWGTVKILGLWSPTPAVALAAQWGRLCWRVAQESVASAGSAAQNLPPTVGLFLLASLLYGGIRGGLSYARTGRFLRRLPLGPSGAPEAVPGRMVSGLGEDIRVRIVEDPGLFAFTGGFLRPSVYVSRGMVRALSGEEVRSVLRHEAAHVARRDPLRGWAADTLASALWFLPVAGHLRRRFLAAAEEEADDRAVSGPEDACILASALVKAARGRARNVYVAAPGFGGEMGATERSVTERVERLVGASTDSAKSRKSAWAPVVARSAGVIALLGIVSLGGFDFAAREGLRAQTVPRGPSRMTGPHMGRMPGGISGRGQIGREMDPRGRGMQEMRERMWERMRNRGGMGPRFTTPVDPVGAAPPHVGRGFPTERPDAGPAR